MELLALALALAFLLALNGFFVLAEFAIVKVRPSRVAELAAEGNPRAPLVAAIQHDLDAYLSVCQVGITLASVALGMVGERTAATLLGASESPARYAVAMGFSYVLISASHILLGELVPKSLAIRLADRAALVCARPLRAFHFAFFPALWLLTQAANAVLRLVGVPPTHGEDPPSEGELRILLSGSQAHGAMSFRRLLFMENVFDFGGLTVRDAMRPRALVRCLDSRAPWATNLATIRASRFSRFPLLGESDDEVLGFVHVKDLILQEAGAPPRLQALARPILQTTEGASLEGLLATMQRRRVHVARVVDGRGAWTGLISLEDVIEELIGTIRDEFEDEEHVRLADALTPARVHLAATGDSAIAAVREALARLPPEELPLPMPELLRAIEGRHKLIGTYLGDGIGMPHARVASLPRPFVMV